MSDPVSAAGFAIGAVSLGIQVCQGLVSYYADWKSCDDDIDRIHDRLRGLGETLEILKKEIMKFQGTNAKEVDDVNKKILSCSDGIHKLQAVLRKCRSSPSANSVHKFYLRTLYPFKKSTLQDLNASVKDLQGNLDTGLLSLLLGAANNHCEGLSVLISASQTREEEFKEIRHEIQNTNTEVEGIRDEVQQQSDIIQATTSNISSTLEAGFKNVQSYQQNHLPALMNRIETLTEVMKLWQDNCQRSHELLLNPELIESQRIVTMQNSARIFQTRLIEKPSLLRVACDEINRYENASLFSSMTKSRVYDSSSSRRYFKRRPCFCSSSTYSSTLFRSHQLQTQQSQSHQTIWNARFNSSTVTHHRGCVLFNESKRKKSWNLRVVYCGPLIAQAVTMSIDLRWGEGSYGISPNLSCDRVVSSNSPIFELITKMEYCFYGAERTSLTEMIDTMIRSIGQLYRDGKASAHDVDEEGNSILHKIVDSRFFDDEERMPEFVRLVKQMSDWGVRLDKVNDQGRTYLDDSQCGWHLDRLGGKIVMVERMVDLGAEFANINDYYTPLFAEYARKFEDFAEASDFDDICKAVLRRSESELRKVLKYSHHRIDEPNARGLRPLHLFVGWPHGIEILLSYRANMNLADECELYPVEHAIQLACPESLALLGEADCALHHSGFGTLGMAICDRGRDQALRASIAEYVIMIVANQRRKLQALLSQHLSESSTFIHSSSEDKLLDVYAFDAVAALKQHGVSIPFSLELGKYYGAASQK